MLYQVNGICNEYNFKLNTLVKGSDKSKEKFVLLHLDKEAGFEIELYFTPFKLGTEFCLY